MTTKVGLYRDRRSGRWVVRWFGEYDPQQDVQRRYSKTFKLKRDAEAFQAEKMQEFGQGDRRDRPSEMTIQAFCRDWLAAHRQEHRLATREIYGRAVDRLKEYFGARVMIGSVGPREAHLFLASQKRRSEGRQGEPISDWSRDQVRRCCKAMFATAVTWGLLKSNPFATIKGKKLATGRWHKITPVEYRALLAAAPDLRWKTLYALAYTAGLRMGELFNLTWSDIDFEHRRLIVADRVGSATMPAFHVKDHESREIPLPQHTLDILTAWQVRAPEGVPHVLLEASRYDRVLARWRVLLADGRTDQWRNKFMVNNVGRSLRVHLRKAGIKPKAKLSLHTFRKSCGQNWAERLPMTVTKELMGHSDISTTAQFYSQVDEDQQAKAARVIDELLAERTDIEVGQETGQ